MTIIAINRRSDADLRNRNQPSLQPGIQHAHDEWKTRALCHTSSELGSNAPERVAQFYRDDLPSKGIERESHEAWLRSFCNRCPVFKDCEQLSYLEGFGFLAGKSENQRAREQNRAKKAKYREAKG